MPKIQNYSFGKIVIDDKSYTRDLIITSNRVIPDWWRAQGHLLSLADLEVPLDEFEPEILVIGTGKFGLLKIPADVLQEIQATQIEIIALKTDGAVGKFNELSQSRNVMGAFHLTC